MIVAMPAVSHLMMFVCRELGVHVDGFIATAGHTLVVGSSKVTPQSFV